MNSQDFERTEDDARRIVVLATAGLIPTVLVNALAQAFPGRVILVEEAAESPFAVARRRARRLGWLAAGGQLATSIVSRLTKSLVQPRMRAILETYGHSAERDPQVPVVRVDSVNGEAARAEIAPDDRHLRPAAILTVACRLLSKETLAAIACPVVNFHAGINPAYRGQMGGYWALALGDRQNFGATIHLVDQGVDTGATLYEVRPEPDRADNLATFPLLLAAAGAERTVQAVNDAVSGALDPVRPDGPSHLRYPPTLWRWLWNGLRRGVW